MKYVCENCEKPAKLGKKALKEHGQGITADLINDYLDAFYRTEEFKIVMFSRLEDGWAMVTMLEDREDSRYLTIRSDSRDEVSVERYERFGLQTLSGGGL